MFNQMQVVPAVSSLAALLNHPDFQRGLAEAREQFLGDYEPAPLDLDEMIDEVEMNLSYYATARDKMINRRYGVPSSYLCNLGFVVGTINEGLTYVHER